MPGVFIFLPLLIGTLLFPVVHSGGGGGGAAAAAVIIASSGNRRCKIDKSAVAWTSLSRDAETIKIEHFRGDGSGQESDEPSVNSSVIYYSLFDKDSFPAIFEGNVVERPSFETKLNPHNHSMSTREFMKIAVKVKNTSKPMRIGTKLPYYFWGASFLPHSEDPQECFYYTSANYDLPIRICNLTEMDRCSAPISDLPHFAPLAFYSETGERLTHFSWLCGSGQTCCAYECCEPESWRAFFIGVGIFVAVLFIVAIVCAVGPQVEKQREWNAARRNSSNPVRMGREERGNDDPRLHLRDESSCKTTEEELPASTVV